MLCCRYVNGVDSSERAQMVLRSQRQEYYQPPRTSKKDDRRGPCANDPRNELGACIGYWHDGHQAAHFGHVKVEVRVLDHLWGSIREAVACQVVGCIPAAQQQKCDPQQYTQVS